MNMLATAEHKLDSHVTDGDFTADRNINHGAHVDCQQGAPFVIAVCGYMLDWNERNDASENVRCNKCYDLAKCPLCGVDLIAMV